MQSQMRERNGPSEGGKCAAAPSRIWRRSLIDGLAVPVNQGHLSALTPTTLVADVSNYERSGSPKDTRIINIEYDRLIPQPVCLNGSDLPFILQG